MWLQTTYMDTHSRQLPKHTVMTSTFITQGKIVFICHILILLFLRVCSKLNLASQKSVSPGCMDASRTTINYLSSLIFQAWVSVIYSTHPITASKYVHYQLANIWNTSARIKEKNLEHNFHSSFKYHYAVMSSVYHMW